MKSVMWSKETTIGDLVEGGIDVAWEGEPWGKEAYVICQRVICICSGESSHMRIPMII